MSGSGHNDQPPAGDAWRSLAAPIGAVVVLILGVSVLFVRASGDPEGLESDTTDSEQDDTPDTEPDEPDVTSTTTTTTVPGLPPVTAPPLIDPSMTTLPPQTTQAPPDTAPETVPDTAPETEPQPGAETPSLDEVRGALLPPSDLTNENWNVDVLTDVTPPCGENEADAAAVHNEAVLYSRIQIDPPIIRQMSHRIVSFPDAKAASTSFDRDIELLESCDGTTIDLNGTSYTLSVLIDAFSEEQRVAFPCSDDNATIILQLNSDDADVPFVAESIAAFRCGLNVTSASFSTTDNLNDLSDDEFFSVVATTNIAVATLSGS